MSPIFRHYETAKEWATEVTHRDGRTRYVFVFDPKGWNPNIVPGPDPQPGFCVSLLKPNAHLGEIQLFVIEGPLDALTALIIYDCGLMDTSPIIIEDKPATELDWMYQNLKAMPIPRAA